MPLRVSALRSLGAYVNDFAVESFVDELAEAAGADPVAFRLAHLDDSRARSVIDMAAAQFRWGNPVGPGRGVGLAFARDENLAGYAAVALEVSVDADTGQVRFERAVAAIDVGEVVNPHGIRDQVEGGIIQEMTWSLYEEELFDAQGVRSRDWSTYPIARFTDVADCSPSRRPARSAIPRGGRGRARADGRRPRQCHPQRNGGAFARSSHKGGAYPGGSRDLNQVEGVARAYPPVISKNSTVIQQAPQSRWSSASVSDHKRIGFASFRAIEQGTEVLARRSLHERGEWKALPSYWPCCCPS